ncbi:MAG: efflux RND transporter permease subunit [Candidatus Omnitrophota bacterium]
MLEKIIRYFVKHHLLTNLIFVVVLIGGILAWNNTSKEEMPDITFDFVRISANYPGASAEEVEHFVTKPIEDKVKGIDGVYRVTSTASEGTTRITVEIQKGYSDRDEAITEIRNAVADTDLPVDIKDDPSVQVYKSTKRAIIDIALIDTRKHLLDLESRKQLHQYVHVLETQLINRPEINSVNKTGYLQEEIQIMVIPEKLREFDIPFNTVMNAVKENHVRQPAGSIETKYEPKVTLTSELDTVDKLNNFIVQAGFKGQVVRLKQIANVCHVFEKSKGIIKINGHEGIMLNVVKNSSCGIIQAIEVVEKVVENFRSNNLKGTSIELVTLDDESIDVRNRLSIIAMNGSIGFVLILIMLFAFLNLRSGIWVAMGIPFTFCFTMFFASFLGYTINNITLAAVIIVMGMIVDDAIVIAEYIARLRSQGVASEEAAVQGAARMFFPVLASIVTTCIAFVPLFFFSGRFGQMNKFIPPIIFLMLGASLFESLVILPGHMHFDILPLKNYINKFRKNNNLVQKKPHWFDRIEDNYSRMLERVLPYKWIIFSVFLILFIGCGYLAQVKMKFVMFPKEETREIVFTGEAVSGTDRYDTVRLTRQIDDFIRPYLGREVVGWQTEVARSRRGGAVEENKFRILVEIVPKEKRRKSADQIIREWEKNIAGIEGLEKIKVSKSRWGQSSGSAIELVVQENNDQLRRAAVEELFAAMKDHPALQNVEIERPVKNPEYKISLKREKIKRLSISPADVSSTIRAALEGTIIYELPNGDEEINVRFTTVDVAKDDIEKILEIPIENQGNYLVPLRDMVDVQKTETPNSIERKDSRRTTSIFADIKQKARVTPLEIADDIEKHEFPQLLSRYPTAMLAFEGEVRDTRESQGDLKNAIFLVIFLIYIILVLLFNSLLKPVIIMLAIPFGIVGIILAFWLHGKTLFGFYAAIGALGLAGVVINDSIIMLDKLDKEYDLAQSREVSNRQISSIAKTRLRAVVLTTLTTVAGIFPTAYGFAGYDAMLAEMMLALSWGLLFGTLITLFLIPGVYSLIHDWRFRSLGS